MRAEAGSGGGGGARAEAGQRLRFVFEVGDAFEKAGYGEGFAHAAVRAEEFEVATLTFKIHERRCDGADTRTINLGHVGEIQKQIVGAVPDELEQDSVQPVIVIADGGSAGEVDDGDRSRFSSGDFESHHSLFAIGLRCEFASNPV